MKKLLASNKHQETNTQSGGIALQQDHLWRTSQAYRFLQWRRRQRLIARVVRIAKKVGETAFVAVVVLGLVVLLLFLLFGVGHPLP